MAEKKRRARKDYRCDRCDGIIRAGNLHLHCTGRGPRYDGNDQVGIEYFSTRTHLNEYCEGILMYVQRPDLLLKDCNHGRHKVEEGYELDGYVGCHAVGAPTGEYFCVNCGKTKREIGMVKK